MQREQLAPVIMDSTILKCFQFWKPVVKVTKYHLYSDLPLALKPRKQIHIFNKTFKSLIRYIIVRVQPAFSEEYIQTNHFVDEWVK